MLAEQVSRAADVPEPRTLMLIILAAAGWSLRRAGLQRKYHQVVTRETCQQSTV
jgi:hypothetical protein